MFELAGIDRTWYAIESKWPNNSNYGIERWGSEWILYFTERGEKYTQEYFPTEDAACAELYRKVVLSFARPEVDTESHAVILTCPSCRNKLRVPQVQKTLLISCRLCNHKIQVDIPSILRDEE